MEILHGILAFILDTRIGTSTRQLVIGDTSHVSKMSYCSGVKHQNRNIYQIFITTDKRKLNFWMH
jgi:hypothetical protein